MSHTKIQRQRRQKSVELLKYKKEIEKNNTVIKKQTYRYNNKFTKFF